MTTFVIEDKIGTVVSCVLRAIDPTYNSSYSWETRDGHHSMFEGLDLKQDKTAKMFGWRQYYINKTMTSLATEIYDTGKFEKFVDDPELTVHKNFITRIRSIDTSRRRTLKSNMLHVFEAVYDGSSTDQAFVNIPKIPQTYSSADENGCLDPRNNSQLSSSDINVWKEYIDNLIFTVVATMITNNQDNALVLAVVCPNRSIMVGDTMMYKTNKQWFGNIV
jgi:serine/threonine protein kinase